MSRIHPTECWATIRDVILRNTPARSGNTVAAVRGLTFHRQDAADKTAPHIFAPVIILVAQGAKLVRVSDEERLFDENICFVCVANMPVFCSVANASPERPYLALSLSLDTGLIATLAAELPPPDGPASELRAATACEVEPELLDAFARLPEGRIRGSGYVVEALEAAVWCLAVTDSLEAALLKAVNLGEDTDTVAAIAGGLAGLYYGYDAIPADWLAAIKRREWIEGLCEGIALQ